MTPPTDAARLPVLLLDDHRVFTDLLAMSLGMQPDLACVAVAHSAREGLARAAAVDFAVAVIDLQLPDGGGLDLIPLLRALRPAARIVVLTAHPRPDLAERALGAGAVAFLGKDAPLTRILDAVRHADAANPVVEAGARPGGVELTHRELDVLRELGQGRDATRIAAALGISVHTARDHIKALMAKLGVHTQLDAVVSAERRGLITLGARY
ncbi:response regulator transcription factor [Pseudonocardia ailaonensis]|uniref:response regulator transcription factor n=1 Tax=Pseudonocardia ailaonensis TaxID=367279 RepID=UPI0031D6C1AD